MNAIEYCNLNPTIADTALCGALPEAGYAREAVRRASGHSLTSRQADSFLGDVMHEWNSRIAESSRDHG